MSDLRSEESGFVMKDYLVPF